MTWQLFFRLVQIGIVIGLFGQGVMYVRTRSQVEDVIAGLVKVQQDAVKAQTGLTDAMAVTNARLAILEHDALRQPQVVVVSPDAWQMNRDREMRERIKRLEYWRYRTER